VTRIAIPAVTVMIVVVSFVAAGAWNRSGEARLVITLSERELPLQWPGTRDGEPQPLRLRVNYQPRFDPLDSRNWLPESRLQELGFNLNIPSGDPRAVDAYDSVPPRLAWVAFEHDGPAWRDIERRQELLAAQNGAPRADATPRLVPVDAAPDFETLRVRYPSGHLILRGVIGVVYVPPGSGGPLVHGTLRRIVPESIAVPADFHDVFGNPADAGQVRPRYEVEVAVGRLGLPYIRAARRLQ
jgi:hypothetical protein